MCFSAVFSSLNFGSGSDSYPVIEVDTAVTYQEIDGFGNCLTGGSATLLHRMDHGFEECPSEGIVFHRR